MTEHNSLKKIVLFLSGVTLLLLVAGGYMLLLLLLKQNEFSQSEQSSSNQKEGELVRARYKTLLDKTKADREKLAGFVIEGDAGTAQLLETIETLGTAQGLTVTQGVSLEKVSTSTKALAVTVETKGDFQNVITFLSSLETLPHELIFRNVVLRRSSELVQKNAVWSLNVAFTLKSFKP